MKGGVPDQLSRKRLSAARLSGVARTGISNSFVYLTSDTLDSVSEALYGSSHCIATQFYALRHRALSEWDVSWHA